MKKLKPSLMAFAVLGSLSLFSASDTYAADPISDKCQYSSARYKS
jgi:hypothetical protein